MPVTGLRAAFFDIGGVVFELDEAAFEAAWAREHGLTATDVLTAMYAGNDSTVLIGAVPLDEWWQVVAGRLRLTDGDLGELRHALDHLWRLSPDMLDAIEQLRSRLLVGFISNAWADLRSILKRRGVLRSADLLVCSAEVGYAKPHPRIFQVACERLGLEPGACVFVDDVQENVAAAESLGMRAILHQRADETARQLGDLLSAT